MTMLTFRGLAKLAVSGNAEAAAKAVDFCRFRHGMTYEQTYRRVNGVAPIKRADWDALLREAEYIESVGA